MAAKIPAPYSESTLSDRYQTIIPELIYKVFGLNMRDEICYPIESDGRVVVSRADETKSVLMLGQFLNFLAIDVQKNPQHLDAISSELVSRIQSLVAHVNVDLNLPLLDEDE